MAEKPIGIAFGKDMESVMERAFEQTFEHFIAGRKVVGDDFSPQQLENIKRAFRTFFMSGGGASIAFFAVGAAKDVFVGPVDIRLDN